MDIFLPPSNKLVLTLVAVVILSSVITALHIFLPPSNKLVLTLVAVVILSSVIIALLCRCVSRSKGRLKRVLIAGPCGAGKTRLLHKLCTGRDVRTVTSMEASSLHWVGGSGKGVKMNQTIDFVDVPGYYRLLGQLRKELNTVSAVVFLVDGSALASSSRVAAEILYEILIHPSLKKCSGLLICCNKSDLASGRESRAMAALTREVQRIRISREAMTTLDDADSVDPLGKEGVSLDLKIDCPCPLEIGSCSAATGELMCIEEFIRKHLTRGSS